MLCRVSELFALLTDMGAHNSPTENENCVFHCLSVKGCCRQLCEKQASGSCSRDTYAAGRTSCCHEASFVNGQSRVREVTTEELLPDQISSV